MKKISSNQSGLAHVAVFFVIIIVVLVSFAGWRVFQNNQPAEKTNAPKTANSTTAEPEPKNEVSKISVIQKGELVLPKGHADPTVVATAAGYRMYVNRQSGGPSGILIYTSPDGITWTKEKDIILPGTSTSRPLVLPTGVRLYYPESQPLTDGAPPAKMLSSFSSDGVNFTKDPGVRVSPRSNASYLEGPTVFQLPDKTWRMYFNENTVAAKMQRDGEIWGASSSDGLTWTRDDKVTMQADNVESGTSNMKAPWKQLLHPFVLANPKGGYIMFYNSHSEMYAATSVDGLAWKKIGSIGIHGADMDGYFQADGSIRAYYGDFNPKDGGLVYMAVLKIQ
jgi:hypothetical protein